MQLGTIAVALSLIVASAPAFAADMPAQRQRPQQAERAPAQQQQSNWSGTQVGGFNGGSSVSNSFVEPGSNLFFSCIATGSVGCVSPITPGNLPDVETPFNFEKDKLSYTFGGFLGHRRRCGVEAWRNKLQFGCLFACFLSFSIYHVAAVRAGIPL
jgi:hypothetical protein